MPRPYAPSHFGEPAGIGGAAVFWPAHTPMNAHGCTSWTSTRSIGSVPGMHASTQRYSRVGSPGIATRAYSAVRYDFFVDHSATAYGPASQLTLPPSAGALRPARSSVHTELHMSAV